MCGIAGILNLNGEPVNPSVIKMMTDSIAHRGPDGEGRWIDGPIGLGHRRLSIIDLTTRGSQPMASKSGRCVLVYNGELYNFRELRKQLEESGLVFNSKTDTEVVLEALEFWGVEALKKFNGMFSLALWDRQKKELLLARDRYGIKPLYYALQGNTFLFGSEQKAFTSNERFQRALDIPSLLEYLTFQNFLTDRTLMEGVRIIPLGNYALIKAGDEELRLHEFWDYYFEEADFKIDAEEYAEELDRLFRQAVNRQLIGDVEVGAYLSGGIDSGAITAIASQSVPNLKTFTCGFDLSSASGIELTFDERSKASLMSEFFNTEHTEMILKSGDMERCLPELAWHLEEPRVGQSYPNYYIANLASKSVKVVLSGAGGDELFAGYPWRYYRAKGNKSFEDFIDHYYSYWQRLADNSDLAKLFAPVKKQIEGVWTRDIFKNVFKNHDISLEQPEDFINHSLYFEAKTFLHGLFVVEDKLSMANGLETRVPFMDNDLVAFAMKCPINLKLKNLNNVMRINENDVIAKHISNIKKTNDGKQILRKVMTRYIPKAVTEAKKQGFSSPDASWFKGESIEFVKKTLLKNDATIFNVLDRKTVHSLVNQHLEGKRNRRLLIWSLLNLEHYLLKY